jgi:hypothetical protein
MEYGGLSAGLYGSVLHQLRGQLWTDQICGNSYGASGQSLYGQKPLRRQSQEPVCRESGQSLRGEKPLCHEGG